MSFWQSKERGEMLIKSKQASKVIFENNILLEKRSIWLWKYGLFVLWVNDIDTINMNSFIEISKKENCVFLQIETFESNDFENKIFNSNLLKTWFYKKFITPFTAIIDLSKTEDDILSEMKPKGRYNIRLAEKKWIIIKEVEKTDKNIEIFYNLVLETTTRDNFNWNTCSFYKTFLETIDKSELIFAYNNEKVISAWIFIFDIDFSIYYYWASTNDTNYRNLMSPYLLQWFAIKKAKNMWSKYYDFLWVSSPWEKNSSLTWVTDFKLKFTKNIVNISKSYIFISNNFIFIIFKIIKFIKKVIKT